MRLDFSVSEKPTKSSILNRVGSLERPKKTVQNVWALFDICYKIEGFLSHSNNIDISFTTESSL